MDGLTLASLSSSTVLSLFSPVSTTKKIPADSKRHLRFNKKKHFAPLASKRDEADDERMQFDEWDLMEMKFGRYLGEDPKLTLAKIKAKKINPDASFLEVEKEFYKNKGKGIKIEEIPFMPTNKLQKSTPLKDYKLVRPTLGKGLKFETKDDELKGKKMGDDAIPNVILRRPGASKEEKTIGNLRSPTPRLIVKQNLSLETNPEKSKEIFSDMILLERPQHVYSQVGKSEDSGTPKVRVGFSRSLKNKENSDVLLRKPAINKIEKEEEVRNEVISGMQPPKSEFLAARKPDVAFTSPEPSENEALLRFDDSNEALIFNGDRAGDATQDTNDSDWDVAKKLNETGDKEEVELITASSKGFYISFRSLVGFLPYQYITGKWKFTPFELWMKQRSNDSENLLVTYEQEKLKFMSSFVGKKVKVSVVAADSSLKKLIVSLRTKGSDENSEKKRSLMAKLQIGDTVKCIIININYIGIFVKIDDVEALIHRSEVSWDATLDPASSFSVGQVVEAKVHRLDFTLERIYLSLKETTPNPMDDTLAHLSGEDLIEGGSEMEREWPEVEALIEELQKIHGVSSVSKGRFLLSPGLAPTFQVYMASMYNDQYKLLARSENKVQELIVQSTLSKEEMASNVMQCANRVR